MVLIILSYVLVTISANVQGNLPLWLRIALFANAAVLILDAALKLYRMKHGKSA